MNFSSQEIPPSPNGKSPRLHRRRQVYFPELNDPQQAETLENLAKSVAPTFDFFTYSLLSGVLMAAGILLRSLPLIVAAALAAPMMAPLLGLQLSIAAGSQKLFFRSAAGMLLGMGLVFVAGMVGGLTAYPPGWQPEPFSSPTFILPVDTWLIFIAGVLLTAMLFLQQKPASRLASALLAFTLYGEVSLCGVLVGRNMASACFTPLLNTALMLSAGIALGSVPFIVSGYRPSRRGGYLLPAILFLLALAIGGGQIAAPAQSPWSVLPFLMHPTATAAATPLPSRVPTATHTPTPRIPTATSTPSVTPSPTPDPAVIRVVNVDDQDSARLRESPGFTSPLVTMIPNGETVRLLGGSQVVDGVTWVEVIDKDGTIGWMVQTVFDTPTPAPLRTITP